MRTESQRSSSAVKHASRWALALALLASAATADARRPNAARRAANPPPAHAATAPTISSPWDARLQGTWVVDDAQSQELRYARTLNVDDPLVDARGGVQHHWEFGDDHTLRYSADDRGEQTVIAQWRWQLLDEGRDVAQIIAFSEDSTWGLRLFFSTPNTLVIFGGPWEVQVLSRPGETAAIHDPRAISHPAPPARPALSQPAPSQPASIQPAPSLPTPSQPASPGAQPNPDAALRALEVDLLEREAREWGAQAIDVARTLPFETRLLQGAWVADANALRAAGVPIDPTDVDAYARFTFDVDGALELENYRGGVFASDVMSWSAEGMDGLSLRVVIEADDGVWGEERIVFDSSERFTLNDGGPSSNALRFQREGMR